ncbi:MAG: hypothetical protein EP297_02060 [Gammaproteobacteria bacterium]|nr:MAG: hypothetical protein EP297_02060 [Gammaproteobacteria bacterium]
MEQLTYMVKQLLLLCVVLVMPASAFATENASDKFHVNAENIAKSLESIIEGYFTDLDTLLGNEELITALSTQDQSQLDSMAVSFAEQLKGSPRVRIFIKGAEEPDYDNSPACGYACIDIAKQSYSKPVNAEAVMYKSADANITLARAIKNKDGQTPGVIIVQYPYKVIKDAMASIKDTGLFIELRQNVGGKNIPLIQKGDQSIRTEAPQKTLWIKNTRWSIAIWTPGGVQVEEYQSPSLPLMAIIGGSAVLLIGIIILIIFIRKVKKSAKSESGTALSFGKKKVASDYLPEDEAEESSRTIIFGGGAADVDVSEYLSKENVTDIQKKTAGKKQ